MTTTIPAIYEAGVLKPLGKLGLRERQRVLIALFPADDNVPTFLISEAALHGKSFDFLADPAEDIYSLSDGEST